MPDPNTTPNIELENICAIKYREFEKLASTRGNPNDVRHLCLRDAGV